ncbi:hypothetical protein RM96_20045 [Cupriavidus sp. IDO]|nr:hypothetical protein RM96_20045 [Cupriavidus sp. IDO]
MLPLPVTSSHQRWIARELFVAGQHPARGRLRIGEEALVGEHVLMGQRGQGLAQLEHGPQDQPLDLAAIGGQRRRAVGIACQPHRHGGQIIARGDSGADRRRAVGAGGAGQRWWQMQALERRGKWVGQALEGRTSVPKSSVTTYMPFAVSPLRRSTARAGWVAPAAGEDERLADR